MNDKPSRRDMGTFLAGIAWVLLANVAFIHARDPLLFWSAKATPAQPLFTTAKQGNVSRFVFAGPVPSLDYRVHCVGPSCVTPFASGRSFRPPAAVFTLP